MDDTPIMVFRASDELVMLVRLAVAFAFGILLGIERRRKVSHPTGIRTMALITGGAAVFMLISQFGFGDASDSGRVAASVVTGVGFLGAGIMIFNRGRVRNLTTAASIWMAAAIGLASGAGLFVLAALATLGSLAFLFLVEPRDRDGEDDRPV